jgi:predicted DNA binding CopG/RHH family protein
MSATPSTIRRPLQLNLRLSAEELALLKRKASRQGLTQSEWLRFAIREATLRVEVSQ